MEGADQQPFGLSEFRLHLCYFCCSLVDGSGVRFAGFEFQISDFGAWSLVIEGVRSEV